MLGDQQATVHWLQTQMAQHQLRHSWWGCTANLHLKGHNEVTVATVFRLVKGTSPMNTLSNKGFWKVLDKLNKRYSISLYIFFFPKQHCLWCMQNIHGVLKGISGLWSTLPPLLTSGQAESGNHTWAWQSITLMVIMQCRVSACKHRLSHKTILEVIS